MSAKGRISTKVEGLVDAAHAVPGVALGVCACSRVWPHTRVQRARARLLACVTACSSCALSKGQSEEALVTKVLLRGFAVVRAGGLTALARTGGGSGGDTQSHSMWCGVVALWEEEEEERGKE